MHVLINVKRRINSKLLIPKTLNKLCDMMDGIKTKLTTATVINKVVVAKAVKSCWRFGMMKGDGWR